MKRNKALRNLGLTLGSLLAAILAGAVLMTAVYALPTARMRHNVSISLPYILAEGDRYQWAPYHNGTELDGFTDSIMLLNAVYEGKGTALHDAMVNPRAEFVPGDSVPVESLSRYAQGGEDYREVTYARYWHGYLLFLKPLLLFFTPSDIRLLNMTVQLILAAVVLALSCKRGGFALAIPLGAGLLCLNPISTALCFQYTDVYLLLLVFAAGMLLLESYRKSWGWLMYLWLGILTGFFDFLTYPVAALGILLVVDLMLGSGSAWEKIRKMLTNSLLWLLGYGGMWAGKWVCASMLTEQNVIADGLKNVLGRTGGEVQAKSIGITQVIWQNLQNYVNPMGKLLVLLLLTVLLWALISKRVRFCLSWQKVLPLLAVALYPAVWYIALRNHSMIHAYMTHRDLAVTVCALCCGVSASLQPRKI